MSAYSVGTARHSGRKTWWVNWQMAHTDMSATHDNIRPATEEEAALMAKVEWETDTPADCEKLRAILET